MASMRILRMEIPMTFSMEFLEKEILKTIEATIDEINRMGHLGAIRATESRQLSGVSRQSEFLMLDSKLCEKVRNLKFLFTPWKMLRMK